MLNEVFHFLTFDLFRKEDRKELEQITGIIRVNSVAKMKGVIDDYNKIIEVTAPNGQVIKTLDYSEPTVNALREVYEMPVVEEKIDDKFDWGKPIKQGVLTYKR